MRLTHSALLNSYRGSMKSDDGASVDATVVALGVRHFFGDGWSAEAELPTGLIRVRNEVVDVGRITGFGDLRVSGSYDFAALLGPGGYTPSIVLRLGAGLPTGSAATINGPLDVGPSQVSLGFGAFSLNGDVQVTQFVHRQVALMGRAGVTAPVTAAANGVRFGRLWSYAAGALYLADPFAISLDVSGTVRSQAEELIQGPVVMSGGHVLGVNLGATFRATERVTFAVNGRLPFWRNVNGEQVTETFTVGGALILAFGGADEHDHEHGDEHDHGDEHEHARADEHDHGGEHAAEHSRATATSSTASASAAPAGDVADAATGGATFDLDAALVADKVTVIDFWAEWCEPCLVLERQLRALAAETPDLAVRRAELVTFDDPLMATHLKGVAGLPVVWIYDRSKQQVAKLESASPDDVMIAVKRALRARPAH